jgi:predicted CoA-binding protein
MMPSAVEAFLSGRRVAVAGVSRESAQPANLILRRLRDQGMEVIPVNPAAEELEGATCYPDVRSVPGPLDGVVIVTHPSVAAAVVRECGEKGVPRVWIHRSFGDGSVSREAVEECDRLGIECIEGGCPMMFCEPVDIAHRCMRWWLQRKGRVPS